MTIAEYLSAQVGSGAIKQIAADDVLVFLDIVQDSYPGMPMPTQIHAESCRVQLVWDREEHHFEVNFAPTGPQQWTWSWFYRNRATEALAEGMTMNQAFQECLHTMEEETP